MEVLQDTYKDSKIGRIPKEWVVVKLKDINEDSLLGGNYKNGEGEKGIPLIKMGNLDRGKIKLNKIQNIPETLVYDNIHILKEGDFLFNTRNTLELVGKVAIWRNELPKALYNSNLLKIDFNKSKVHSTKFMNYVFNSDLVIKKLRGLATGSTSVAAIYNKDLFKLKVPLPPVREQQKIAAILSTVDEQISTTDKIIEKSKELKKGLMQKLFSEGIGHTEFKDSKIGRIPKCWKLRILKDCCEKINVGFVGTCEKYYCSKEDGVLLLRTGNLNKGKLKMETMRYVLSEFNDKNTKSQLFPGDIIIARHGDSGQAVIIPEDFEKSNCLNIIIIRSKNENYPLYIKYLINSPAIVKQVKQRTAGSTQKVINTGAVAKLKIPIASKLEQQKIAAILSEADAKIEKEQTQKTQLEALKKGLMQQLLTGKKRVKV